MQPTSLGKTNENAKIFKNASPRLSSNQKSLERLVSSVCEKIVLDTANKTNNQSSIRPTTSKGGINTFTNVGSGRANTNVAVGLSIYQKSSKQVKNMTDAIDSDKDSAKLTIQPNNVCNNDLDDENYGNSDEETNSMDDPEQKDDMEKITDHHNYLIYIPDGE